MTAISVYLFLLIAMSILHAVVLFGFIVGLRRLRRNGVVDFEVWPSVSVIIPARNEAEVLERTIRSLLRQDYPGQWEIIVVDDRSTDETPQVLRNMSAVFPVVRSIRIVEPFPASPKKNALATGIRAAKHEIIATSDADCEYNPSWLRAMVRHFTPEVGVVAGLTVFNLPADRVPLWQRIQWLDFFVQNFLAAGAAGAGVAASCNGSNLLYRRRTYEEIAGFGGTSLVVSGDDVLFAQRVSKLTKWKIRFSAAPETIVRSLPVVTIRELFQQRLRWASKGLNYRRSMLAFLFGTYTYYLMLIAVPFVWVQRPDYGPLLASILAWKWCWDYVTVHEGAVSFDQRELLPYFLPYSVLQTILYPFIGIAGLLIPYQWKGDWYRTARMPRILRKRRTGALPLVESQDPARSNS